jgi:hypothetical protein
MIVHIDGADAQPEVVVHPLLYVGMCVADDEASADVARRGPVCMGSVHGESVWMSMVYVCFQRPGSEPRARTNTMQDTLSPCT